MIETVKKNSVASATRPRLGFLGVGWIGRLRLEAVQKSCLAEIALIADPQQEALAKAALISPQARLSRSFEEMLESDVDGIVIATPSALHARQAMAALANGKAVFCQKPLGRTSSETKAIIETARNHNSLLAVDLSYRFCAGMQKIRKLISEGELGRIYAVNLVFHNAYGPDKAWFYDPVLSGGGCVMDLGIHLTDLALWTLGWPEVVDVNSRLFAQGELLRSSSGIVEDYAVAQFSLKGGATMQMACSWKLNAGCDCVIETSFYGTGGGASLRNVNGSFYDFIAERFQGTARSLLTAPPDDWGGRAVVDWVRQLGGGNRFNPEIEKLTDVASVLDRIYQQ